MRARTFTLDPLFLLHRADYAHTVWGSVPESLHGAAIECFHDHRIAMSFAVLGCRVPEVVITDRECVEKTYPEFWLDLEVRVWLSCVYVLLLTLR